jgi:hypothetical protein
METTIYTQFFSDPNNNISILEKINQLTDLQDPDKVGSDYFQYLGSNLGYDISINRDELGTSGTESINEKYIRFVLSNLPNFYKTKTTENSIKSLMFSFGFVTNVLKYYSEDYDETNGGKWLKNGVVFDTTLNKLKENLDGIPNNYFPTPHFSVEIDLTKTAINYGAELANTRRKQIVEAIDSIRPANSVFRGVGGRFDTIHTQKVKGYVRYRKHIKLIDV